MLVLILALALGAPAAQPKPATHPKQAPAQAACPTEPTPATFIHKQHVEKLRTASNDKVGGCNVCHDRKDLDHGCRARLHPGFTCRSCHIRIPGADAAR